MGIGTKRVAAATSSALCGYLMLDGGAELRYVAEYLGHEKIESTKLYTRVSLEKLRAVHRDTHPTEK